MPNTVNSKANSELGPSLNNTPVLSLISTKESFVEINSFIPISLPEDRQSFLSSVISSGNFLPITIT